MSTTTERPKTNVAADASAIFRANVKAWLKHRSTTPLKMARTAEIESERFKALLKGDASPTLDEIVVIAGGLGTDAKRLAFGKPPS